MALDAALAEIDAGHDVPSTHWRRDWSLLLGLERLLSQDEPRLADGTTTLDPHQVDALSGTLTALLAERLRGAANGERGAAAPVLAVEEDEDEDAPAADDDEVAAELAALDEEHAEDEEDEDERGGRGSARRRRVRGRRLVGQRRRDRRGRRRRRASTTPTRTSASGSSTRPAPARRSPRWASSRPRGPAAS